MEKTFCCEASKLAWELYKQEHELCLLELYLNLEYDFIKINENVDEFDYDQGMEL